MVTIYGLNKKIGNLTYYDSSSGNEYGFTKPYSEKTAELIDEEISKMIEEQYQRAISILNKHKDKLTELATVLLDKEVIFKDNLQKIFGDRPYSKLETNAIKDTSNDVNSELIEDDKSESILKEKKNKL